MQATQEIEDTKGRSEWATKGEEASGGYKGKALLTVMEVGCQQQSKVEVHYYR